jgi:hypothetical protein
MIWSKYSLLKTANKVAFSKEKETIREEVKEVKDSDGNVTTPAQAKEEREYIALVQKLFDSETGEALDDLKREYSLSELEEEKARYDDKVARAKAESDELAKAIKEKPVLSLDNKEYVIEDMTDEQKMMVNHINDLQNKQNTNQFMADQLQVGKEAFINMLKSSLSAGDENTEVEAAA